MPGRGPVWANGARASHPGARSPPPSTAPAVRNFRLVTPRARAFLISVSGSGSGPDHAAVDAPDHQRGRSGPPPVRPLGPAADRLRGSRIAPLARRLSRVLDVDEEVSTIGGGHRPGDLAAARTGPEATHLAGRRIRGEHLIVAHARVVPLVERAGRDIGLDPQYA